MIKKSIDEVVRAFGGVDIVVNDIGTAIVNKDESDGHNWQKYLDINVTKHQNLLKNIIPYLKEGINPNLIIIASKDFIDVGNEHVIYTAVDNDQIQLSNKTTTQLSKYGIRVNTIYPRKVLNSNMSDKSLQDRAELCGLSLEEYLDDDNLKIELEAYDTAILARTIASSAFGRTTGAQLKVDCAI